MKTCIEFNGVSKKYEVGEKAFYALNNVSFSIDQHEMVVILGPSGAGKSTLLNIIKLKNKPNIFSTIIRKFFFTIITNI